MSGYDSRGKAVFIVTTSTFVLATVFVAARLFSRFGVLGTKTADDWCIIIAWCIAFGLSFAIDYGCSKGLGRHDADIRAEWLSSLRKSEYAFTILYNPALMATKTSILILYLRLSRNHQKFLRIAAYVTLAIVNIAGLVLTFFNAFQCNPPRAAYDPLVKMDKCISIVTLYLCSAPVNIITDLAILVLPIPVLTGMRLPQRQKTVLVFTFALGIFVTIVDVVRIYYLQQAVTDQAINSGSLGSEVDFSWNASTALMWSAVEVNVGIICACIPTLKPLIKHVLPSMITGSNNGSVDDKTGSFSSHVHVNRPISAPPAQRSSFVDPAVPAPIHINNSEQQLDMMDFLTMPAGMGDVTDPTNIVRSPTVHTHKTQNTVYFGFINMQRPKSMLKTKGMESFKYCAIVTILFFLWGFSYGLLNTLNNEIAKVAHQSESQSLGLTSAYFGAYLFGSLTVGQWVLRHEGFKATFIWGLCIYGTGTLMFWPSAVLTSYPGFIISQFVVAFGLSVLETAANPFIALCGPAEYAEYRLLLSQAVQATATILSQVLAEKVLFNDVSSASSLIDVQWTYLAIALFTVILALFFYYMPLPEATDSDLQAQSESFDIYHDQGVLPSLPKLPLIYVSLALAIFSQFCYVAAQESMSIYFAALLTSLQTTIRSSDLTLTTDDYTLLGHSVFAISRFAFAPLCLYIPPRILLLASLVAVLICSILTMSLGIYANGIAGPALVFFFFEGPIFPLIYAIGLRGMGRWTKWAAAGISAACCGGGVFPFIMFAVQKIDRKSVQYSYCVIVALSAFGLLFPIYLSVVRRARWQVDPKKQDLSLDRQADERPVTPTRNLRRFSKRFSGVFEKIKGGSGDANAEVEHREIGGREAGPSFS